MAPFKTFLSPCHSLWWLTTFKTPGKYEKWLWLNSAHITYVWHVLLLRHTYLHTHIYIFIYRTSSNLYTPDSVFFASLNKSVSYIGRSSAGTRANTTDRMSDILRIQSTMYLSCTHAYAKGTHYGKILE